MAAGINRILVVEDDPITRKQLRALLLRMGAKKVDLAADGNIGWAMLKDSEYDLIISDWHMPNRDGLQLLKAVRSDHAFDGIPFVMLTAETEKNSILTAVEAGVNGYIIKPFSPIVLEEKVRAVTETFPYTAPVRQPTSPGDTTAH